MSLIQKYHATQEAIKELQAQMAAMEKDGALKKEMEFESKLRTLLGEYNKALPDVINILDPQAKAGKAVRGAVKTTGTKRARKVKQYKNPHNGEVIETKGGNHKTLKEWKAKWGGDVVEGWATLLG
ncbi:MULTISPECIES: histone-like nucleoid-structuring protein MvaT [Pseudomonas]|uniref:Transcriptional regulator MvaT, P16 subunit n=2 Tax=Pseudomonas TaxID=286 RepID=A0A0C2E808_9PSED|nr:MULTISPECIES: histone-like nucleoid-structuring protein MvaT [Pseudomonas]KIH82008.1 Transcriptional regulator MvaT, P16 subunit [Pseudomonas batumici]KIH82034.1 Transcriptional regulator MvaT, P16 subunit [Pseudomonas batumici]MPQ67259.1 H-NS histone [Pseudomonas sp. MWU12-2323]NWB85163.1 DNA binding protein [Pseudomonas gingeri]